MTTTTKRHYSTLSLYPRSTISLCSLVSNHSASLTRGTTYSAIKRTHLLSLYEHAQRITDIALGTMHHGSKKQASKGSLPTDNFAPEYVRVLRADCLRDKRTLSKQALVDSFGISLYNLPNKDAVPTGKYFAGFSVAYSIDNFADYSDNVTSISDRFTDSIDMWHEVAIPLLEIDNERSNKDYFLITDQMFLAGLARVHKYVRAQKRKQAQKETIGLESYSEHSTIYSTLQYFDIDNTTSLFGVTAREHDKSGTDKKYIGFMSAYELLQKELTSTQARVLRGLARGEQYRVIARKIYGKDNVLSLADEKTISSTLAFFADCEKQSAGIIGTASTAKTSARAALLAMLEKHNKHMYSVKNNVRAIRKVASEILAENSDSVLSILYDRETKKVKIDTVKFTSEKRTISFIDAISAKKINTVVSTDTSAILDKKREDIAIIPVVKTIDIRTDKNERAETKRAQGEVKTSLIKLERKISYDNSLSAWREDISKTVADKKKLTRLVFDANSHKFAIAK